MGRTWKSALPSAQTTTITMDGPKSITATWSHQYRIDLRFANGVTSAGAAVTDRLAEELRFAEGAPR